MTATTSYGVERWTPLSVISVGTSVGLILALACGPIFLGANSLDKLTTLFIYVMLAVMWNAYSDTLSCHA